MHTCGRILKRFDPEHPFASFDYLTVANTGRGT